MCNLTLPLGIADILSFSMLTNEPKRSSVRFRTLNVKPQTHRRSHSLLYLTNEERFERTRRVVPLQSLAVPVPQFQAVLLFAVLVLEVVGLARIPIGEGDGAAGGHPEEAALLGEVGAGGPEVLVAETW